MKAGRRESSLRIPENPKIDLTNVPLPPHPSREAHGPEYWTNRAWAERRHVGLETAEETLLLARELFPKEPLVHYNLACYAAQLGRIDDAKALLATALTLDPVFKEMALEDEDLAGVW